MSAELNLRDVEALRVRLPKEWAGAVITFDMEPTQNSEFTGDYYVAEIRVKEPFSE